ncbi:MAG: hypothetical protein HY240_09975 [Actinobacteria bacterium]|nr:hypothetical protein [Actinomycetota bacterium]
MVRMHRYLVVANQTLAGGHLVSTLRDLASHGPCRFHVLVPATPPTNHTWSDGEARGIAARRLGTALERFHELDPEVDGEVGDEHPLQAIQDVMDRGERFDGIVLSTLPPGISRWLRFDLVHRVEGAFDLPVIHVVGEREPEHA